MAVDQDGVFIGIIRVKADFNRIVCPNVRPETIGLHGVVCPARIFKFHAQLESGRSDSPHALHRAHAGLQLPRWPSRHSDSPHALHRAHAAHGACSAIEQLPPPLRFPMIAAFQRGDDPAQNRNQNKPEKPCVHPSFLPSFRPARRACPNAISAWNPSPASPCRRTSAPSPG